MKKLKIGLDFDGVIANCALLKSIAGQRIFGIEIPPDRFTKAIVIGQGHLSVDQYAELQIAVYHTEGYAKLLEPIPNAIETIRQLLAQNYSIQVITSRGDKAVIFARAWLVSKGLSIDVVSIGNSENKLPAATSAGIDVFVDDDHEKLLPLIGAVSKLYWFTQNDQGGVGVHGSIRQIGSWDMLYKEIQRLAH